MYNCEPILLSVEQTAKYLNLGLTKTRQLFKDCKGSFVVKVGGRYFAHKELLDKWLKGQVVR